MIKKIVKRLISELRKLSAQKDELIYLSLVLIHKDDELNRLLKKISAQLDVLIQKLPEDLK
jgi:hypothetical protein